MTGSDSFFQVVPPTPFNRDHPLLDLPLDNSGRTSHQHQHHLRPSQSAYSLRAHRSISSIGSIDSHQSGLSDLSQWSTSETDFEPYVQPHRQACHSSSSSNQSNHEMGKMSGLSIDPKLFLIQPTRDSSPFSNEEDLVTAKPKGGVTKGKAQPKKAKGGETKKKISHARKVSLAFRHLH